MSEKNADDPCSNALSPAQEKNWQDMTRAEIILKCQQTTAEKKRQSALKTKIRIEESWTKVEKQAINFLYVIMNRQIRKMYTGLSTNPFKRIGQHFDHQGGSAWTKKHTMNEIYMIMPFADKDDEDKVVLRLMNAFGIGNVRGGSFCQIDLDSDQIKVARRQLIARRNGCFHCGGDDHMQHNCPGMPQNYDLNVPKNQNKNGYVRKRKADQIETAENDETDKDLTEEERFKIAEAKRVFNPKYANVRCNSCQQLGHAMNYCPTVKCHKCGERGHTSKQCQNIMY